MNKSDIDLLYNYNYWANARILAAAARLTPAQYGAQAAGSFGSLRATLVHTLAVEILWRQRCQEGLSPTSLLGESDLPTFAALQARWTAEEKAMRVFLDGLDDAALLRRVSYRSTKGISYENPLAHLLLHLVNHGTQSRSEAGMILTQLGQSPGDIDFVLFLRETGR